MKIFEAQWPAPKHIRALTTQRTEGLSEGGYRAFNLAEHVGDDALHVAANRSQLRESLALPNEPIWLNQTHSTRCAIVDTPNVDRDADAAITRQRDQVLVVMTADCLPIVMCDQQGTEIAAIHAGWRGLASGILDTTTVLMHANMSDCLAWIGPAICGGCYETGAEVLDTFSMRYPFAHKAFRRIEHQWYADLSHMATLIFAALGVTNVHPSNACTFESSSQFYSYRRESQTGRIATLIWFQDFL